MSGHSHWKQIQHKKESQDKKKGQAFSKLLSLVAVAARGNPDPQFNPRLRTAIETARAANVPSDNIERAIARSSESKNLEELTIEAYGPEKSALIIECITDSRNRTISEIRHLLDEHHAKFADEGSVRWSFERTTPGDPWKPKFTQAISEKGNEDLRTLIDALETRDDVQRVVTNIE